MKVTPCTSTDGKHTWAHVRDYLKQMVIFNQYGKVLYSSVRGEYKCATCGAERSGRASKGADLRKFMESQQ